MIHFIDYISDRFTETDNVVAKTTGFAGGFIAMIYFNYDMMSNPTLLFTWVGLVSTIVVFATSAITTIIVLIATDLYKYAKPKTVKYFKAKFLIIKTKYLTNGKGKKVA